MSRRSVTANRAVWSFFLLLTTLAGMQRAVSADALVLLRDDFDGSSLDSTRWVVPTGPESYFGRTQIRPPSEPLTVSGGVIRLQLDTYNPDAQTPGDSFFGSEIDTIDSYPVETGLYFEARVRLQGPVPAGLVGGFFSYVFLPPDRRDEIDFELLSNDLVAGQERVLTNVFDDDDFSQPGVKSFAVVSGLDLGAFNTYAVLWQSNRIEWFVNGESVREETVKVPDDPMTVRLNFWAPDSNFAEAYSAALTPAVTEPENEIYFFEVDYVEIRRVPPLPVAGLRSPLALALALVAAAGLFTLLHARDRAARA